MAIGTTLRRLLGLGKSAPPSAGTSSAVAIEEPLSGVDPDRIVLVNCVPENYAHVGALAETVEAMSEGLRTLGLSVAFLENSIDPTCLNLMFGAHMLRGATGGALPPQVVLFNLEQITPGSEGFGEEYLELLRTHTVWEYSARNRDTLNGLGARDVDLVGIGYVPSLTRIKRFSEPDIDVLFYGAINERRQNILRDLLERGLRVESLFGVYGAQRDAYIARSKIVLNLHYYPSRTFEIVRVSYLLANGAFVLSERGADLDEEAPFVAAVEFVPYEDIVERCIYFLGQPTLRAARAEKGLQLIRARPQAELLREPLARLRRRFGALA